VPVRGLVRGGSLLIFVVLGGAWGLAGASASSPSPAPAALTASGTVEGTLTTTSPVQVKLKVQQRQGWQHITTVDVNLVLRNRSLDLLRFTPSASLVEILGYPPPARLGQTGVVAGSYLKLDPSKVKVQTQGTTLQMAFPLNMVASPPAGARLELAATDDGGGNTGSKPLTPPVESTSGFSIGTLFLAIAVAVFAGGFIGNLFSSRRRRPAARPSIYGVVARRMEEEKAKT
jgi:hypothetical protein